MQPNKRWYQHKADARREIPRQVICCAIRKHGSSNFIFEVIACCLTQEDADYTESELIQQYDSQNKEKGYNIEPGGVGGKGGISEETRQKISVSLMGNKRAAGMRHSKETKLKMSEAHMGNSYGLGYRHSSESRKRMVLERATRPKKLCSICGKKDKARGLCNKHYIQLRMGKLKPC